MDKRQLKVKENRNEDTGTYLNTNTSDDHEYQVLIFPEPVRVIDLIKSWVKRHLPAVLKS